VDRPAGRLPRSEEAGRQSNELAMGIGANQTRAARLRCALDPVVSEARASVALASAED
jgi:hypothetical protein